MVITESTLNKFKKNVHIMNEGLHLPHGTKSAKLVCHVDLDGVTSAISMVQQLQKQGIPKERIQIEFAQYGDEKKDSKFDDRFRGKKGQYVGTTDFAKLPRAKPYELFNRIMNFRGNKVQFLNFMKSHNFSKMNLEEFRKVFESNFKFETNKFTDGSIKKLYEALRAYYELGKEAPEANIGNIETLEYKTVNPYFLSDHHSNDQGALSPGQHGEIATGSPSENEFLADKYTPGFWSKEDIEAISTVDAARYTEEQLKNTVFLEKHFHGPDKKKNLATIISTIYDNMVKKDKRAAKYVILNAGPNLVSLYSTTLKAAGLSKQAEDAFNMLKDGKVHEACEIMKTMPKIFQKNWTDKDTHKDVKPIMGLDDWREKNAKDLANAKTGYHSKKDDEKIKDYDAEIDKQKADAKENKIKQADHQGLQAAKKAKEDYKEELKGKKGKFIVHNNFTIFNGTDKRIQYTRYLGSLYSKDGKRSPFTIRYWDGFFQAAKSPLYDGEVDFSVVQDAVLADLSKWLIEKGLTKFNVDRIMENMKKENGGHKGGIWSFQGFDMIKPTGKELSYEGTKLNYYDKKEFLKRAQKVGAKLPKLEADVDSKEEIVDKYKALKKEALEYAMNRTVYWVNKKYPVSEENCKRLANDDARFEGK